jgi:hypothetical protein
MMRLPRPAVILAAFIFQTTTAIANEADFSFSIVSHPIVDQAGESALSTALDATDDDNLAFVVVNGIKSADEPCSDDLYARRAARLNEAQNGIVVSLAADDWAECKNEAGKSAAIGKLNRLREVLFADEFSLGSSKIPVLRQSTSPKFRSYVENARWEIGATMFATINVPGNNNHYVSDAGRNSEFEDRTVANRDWLRRIFTHAAQKKMDGIVLFSDADPLASARQGRRDGYLELRRQIGTLADHYRGKILIVYGDAEKPASKTIRWKGNLGELNAASGVTTLAVSRSTPYFTVSTSARKR